VIVAGAGPAGALAATILARAGVRVQMVDRDRFPRGKLCGDTLNPGALRVLGLHLPLETLLARALPLDGMILTGPGVAVVGTYGQGRRGHAVTRRVLDVILVEQALGPGSSSPTGRPSPRR
jgi:menaquinone-9 beta-reductase